VPFQLSANAVVKPQSSSLQYEPETVQLAVFPQVRPSSSQSGPPHRSGPGIGFQRPPLSLRTETSDKVKQKEEDSQVAKYDAGNGVKFRQFRPFHLTMWTTPREVWVSARQSDGPEQVK